MKRKLTAEEEKAFYKRELTFREKFCVNHYVRFCEYGDISIERSIKLLPFILLFIPSCFIECIYLMWDGGLREFELPTRNFCPTRYYYSDYKNLNPTIQKMLDESKKIKD